MKNIFLVIFLSSFLSMSTLCFAEGWGFGGGGNNTQVILNDKGEGEESQNSKKTKESTYSIDVEGMGFVMPDQPADDQFIQTVIAIGGTYKFSDLLHISSKVVQFDVKGPKNTSWHHEHYLAGAGIRTYIFDKSQQVQLNVMTGTSSVKEKELGSVKNLEAPVFFDIKYFWLAGDNFAIGPQITFGRVANKCDKINGTYLECGHGGFTSFMLGIQIGIPEEWGN